MEPFADVVERYADFARFAEGDSACFVDWAQGVAQDRAVQAWLGELPVAKQQPNLVFAAARWHGVAAPAPYAVLRRALLGDDGRIRATVLARATQTNEAGRTATLLPAIAASAQGQAVALIEVGASAGLCLFPDRWSYRWTTPDGDHTLGPGDPLLSCVVTGPAPLPATLPEVRWRGGVDLNPLDVASDEDRAWLLTLVWPEDDARRRQLASAIDVARADPPDLRRGDLLELLPGLVDEARAAVGPEGVVVVFHSAVITYLDESGRDRFVAMMGDLVAGGRCHWISNESRHVFPAVTASGPEPPFGRFVLAIDGQAVGHTHAHGRALHWWP